MLANVDLAREVPGVTIGSAGEQLAVAPTELQIEEASDARAFRPSFPRSPSPRRRAPIAILWPHWLGYTVAFVFCAGAFWLILSRDARGRARDRYAPERTCDLERRSRGGEHLSQRRAGRSRHERARADHRHPHVAPENPRLRRRRLSSASEGGPRRHGLQAAHLRPGDRPDRRSRRMGAGGRLREEGERAHRLSGQYRYARCRLCGSRRGTSALSNPETIARCSPSLSVRLASRTRA